MLSFTAIGYNLLINVKYKFSASCINVGKENVKCLCNVSALYWYNGTTLLCARSPPVLLDNCD